MHDINLISLFKAVLIFISSSSGYVCIFSLSCLGCALSCLFKCLCSASAVTLNQSIDGLGLSLSSILLELLQRAVEEGKNPESYHQHLVSPSSEQIELLICFLPQVEAIQRVTQSWILTICEAFTTLVFFFSFSLLHFLVFMFF